MLSNMSTTVYVFCIFEVPQNIPNVALKTTVILPENLQRRVSGWFLDAALLMVRMVHTPLKSLTVMPEGEKHWGASSNLWG